MLDNCVPGGINYKEPDSSVSLPPLVHASCWVPQDTPFNVCNVVQVTLPPTRFSAAGPPLRSKASPNAAPSVGPAAGEDVR